MLLTLATIMAVVAPDTTTPRKTTSSLRFTGDAGYVSTSGNSAVQTLNLGYKVAARINDWEFNQQFAVVHGKNRGEVVTALWRGSFRTDYTVQPGVSVYALLGYERNVFAGLRSRVSNNAGIAATALEDVHNKLTVEGGISVTAQRGIGDRGRDLDFLGGRAATAFTHRLGPKASVAQMVELLPNFRDGDDIRINSESTLLAPITKQIGVKISYVIRYDGLPESGYETTDRLFTSGIQVTL